MLLLRVLQSSCLTLFAEPFFVIDVSLLLGSISNYLVHNSSVPVMVVRAPKKSKGKKKARRGRMVEQTRSVREANLKYEQAFGEDH